MQSRYFTPHIGKSYKKTRTLIVSESAYDWFGDDGLLYTPQNTHPSDSIVWNIEHFGSNQYFRGINRVISGMERPSLETMRNNWERYAYTIFVQQSVGQGPGKRPRRDMWDEAGAHFLELIEEIRPVKVIVTGVDMWNRMPDTSVQLLNNLQAYRLKDGALVWCLAVAHPANRRTGFRWKEISESVRLFEASKLPECWPQKPK